QLEDLATNKSIGSAKRSREIGRIRDLLETQPFASHLHQIFTFHSRAADALEVYWEANRLPRYEIADDNRSSVVWLQGIKDDEQVALLLKTYLEPHRLEDVADELLPFEADTLAVLRRRSAGRPGILLAEAQQLFAAAAERELG